MVQNAKLNEKEVLDSLLMAYPGFLREGLRWSPGPDPPDFITTSAEGERLGLEMTEWLHKAQTSVSISNQESRIQLLQVLVRACFDHCRGPPSTKPSIQHCPR